MVSLPSLINHENVQIESSCESPCAASHPASATIQILARRVATRDLYINMAARAAFQPDVLPALHLLASKHEKSVYADKKQGWISALPFSHFHGPMTRERERERGREGEGNDRAKSLGLVSGAVEMYARGPCLPGWNVTWSITGSWKLGPKRCRVRGFGG